MQRPRQFPVALGASFGVMLACYTALAAAGYWYWVSEWRLGDAWVITERVRE